jgi:3-phosphoshikimate 1-carboxyvinyltransferase
MKVAGSVRVPGDKSITHRALLLAAMAKGTSYLGSPLISLDARSTARVVRRLGAEVSPLVPGQAVRIRGHGRFRPPAGVLDCGNSGTTARLTLGLLAAHRFRARVTGDASLRRRPMRRVTDPLEEMGAHFTAVPYDGLPVTIRGGRLKPLTYGMPVSSAQVKSALLLAGYAGRVAVTLLEPGGRSRDHTEVMLRGLGLDVREQDGWIRFIPGARIAPFEMQIPGDISSAAFLLGAALMAEDGELAIESVGLNPTRAGFLTILERMGAWVQMQITGNESGEPVGTLLARPSMTRGVEISPSEIPGIIDEIPMLAALATRSRGVTVFHEAGELRVKESDRLGLLASNIRAIGGRASVEGNDLLVEGTPAPPAGRVTTAGDHRLAMAFAALATVPGSRVRVEDLDCANVSFPGFREVLRSIGGRPTRG